MFVLCILSVTDVSTWFKSMRTMYVHLRKLPASGQPPRVLTARQRWLMSSLQFLSTHMSVRAPHSQLGKITVAPTVTVAEGDDDDEDAVSVTSSQAPSQVASTSQAGSQQPRDRRSPRAAAGGRKVDDAILSLLDDMKDNTATQDRLESAEQEAARPRAAFCQWIGLEMAKLD